MVPVFLFGILLFLKCVFRTQEETKLRNTEGLQIPPLIRVRLLTNLHLSPREGLTLDPVNIKTFQNPHCRTPVSFSERNTHSELATILFREIHLYFYEL